MLLQLLCLGLPREEWMQEMEVLRRWDDFPEAFRTAASSVLSMYGLPLQQKGDNSAPSQAEAAGEAQQTATVDIEPSAPEGSRPSVSLGLTRHARTATAFATAAAAADDSSGRPAEGDDDVSTLDVECREALYTQADPVPGEADGEDGSHEQLSLFEHRRLAAKRAALNVDRHLAVRGRPP